MKMEAGKNTCYEVAPFFTFNKAAVKLIALLEDGKVSLAASRKVMSESFGVSILVATKGEFISRLSKFID